MGADAKAMLCWGGTHSRLVIFVSLRMAASAVAPSAPMLLYPRLRARGRTGDGERVGVSMGADKKANASRGSGALEVGDLRLVEDGSERSDALVFHAVGSKTANKGQDAWDTVRE